MNLPYFFAADIKNFTSTYTLDEATSRHCVQVLRMKPGDAMQLTDGEGNLVKAVIEKADKKACEVVIEEMHYSPREGKQVSVAVSLLKNVNRFEWFLEKATELGVHEIIPLLCARTEKQHFRYERAHGLLVAAMLQSRQCRLPFLKQPTKFDDLIATAAFNNRLIAYCGEAEKTNLTSGKLNEDVQILIGPEGDFTDEEFSLAIKRSYKPVTLGGTRLRTETAGIVASALLLHGT